MPQIFKRSTNAIARITIYGALFFIAAAVWVVATLDRSAYSSRQGVIQKQPIPFSHAHHVSAIGIDCRYCHTSVEESGFAGIPPTATCMNCHKQIWSDSDMLAPVRSSWDTGEPLHWRRVHDLPDHVYFDHSIHVQKGIGCSSCHGRVDRMPLMWKAESMKMEWCLACHRHPERHIRPREAVFEMDWQPPADDRGLRARLVDEYDIASPLDLTSCSTCHR